MRLLFLTHAFNSLAQRLWIELAGDGHDISIEYDINDAVTREAVALWRPDAVLAPFLKRAIPEDVWRAVPCLVVHPGPPGDRGPAALDHAVQAGRGEWGVTVLEAVAEMDAGPVWAHRAFPIRPAAKSSLYRREVTEAAVAAVRGALARLAAGRGPLMQANRGAEGAKPALAQADRAIDWARAGTASVLARIRAADGRPGVGDVIAGQRVRLHDAHPGRGRGVPGQLIGRTDEAVLRATADGAVWIGHLGVELPEGRRLKLPAVPALRLLGVGLPAEVAPEGAPNRVSTEMAGEVAVIRFPFLNGAMSVARSRALEAAIRAAAAGPARAILLAGGPEFWSNGIDLATIEASDRPAEESWAAIEAIDDVCLAMLEARDRWVVAAMAGNAGAGGVFMALAADRVLARDGVVLSPHYKNMGNLFGSEYWTYLLPRRLGSEGAARLMASRMPLSAAQAEGLGLVDAALPGDPAGFEAAAVAEVQALVTDGRRLQGLLAAKAAWRRADEAHRPLAAYRADELARMRLNFFGFDTSYHVARHDFILSVPKSRTPLHLARHRRTHAAAAV
ncbi:MAG: hydrogenase maturation protein [Rhodobacteraceae bacterium]|jgi:putative two-component system hydrogenase maturation factor HypX/HoxX|nr:hydrogenase maturation protein [Paracoccaceae bacterium]